MASGLLGSFRTTLVLCGLFDTISESLFFFLSVARGGTCTSQWLKAETEGQGDG